ncbi:MAG: HAMP domain-containing sensor histidine kinase [Eubacteriales bacterium]|nr:HAMP domain-containing sensor histidine kinase [Eubacteriales bacterium]
MKSMMKILTRYVLSAAGVALVLLIVNFAVFVAWTVQSGRVVQKDDHVSQLSDNLTESGGVYTLSESARETIEQRYQWAMLLNENGSVIWSKNLPDDLPLKYSVSDVARFTRWYLDGYPVNVWQHSDGLFVLGSAKGSMWKYNLEYSQKFMGSALTWIPAALIFNSIAAVLLALLFGLRLFRSLKPLAKGIEAMSEKQPVDLSTRGLLGDLADGINKTSAQLTRQEADLSRRDNARASWIAGVSHDIRTPLSIVMGYASQLEDDPELPLSKREQAGVIRKQSERIKTLINDLNLASKLEYDMQPIRKSPVALAALLRQIAADFINGGLPEIDSIDVKINDGAQNAIVTGDEQLLRRAISNLITNSIQHNPDGCCVMVALENDTENCSISVSDNGIGFTKEQLADLNRSNSSAMLENHGIGLTIVRQIVRAQGGTAVFRNLPEGGCVVVLCLPVSAMSDR